MYQDEIPEPPIFTEEEIEAYRKSKDYTPILFEWYNHVREICCFISNITLGSKALNPILPAHYAILIGLLNRCSRLMLANITLSRNGLFGETTAIIDRCIFETTVKINWLCDTDLEKENRFSLFMAAGLKTEVKLKKKIEENILNRNGKSIVIEDRMLGSIDRCLKTCDLTDDEIEKSSNLPTIEKMIGKGTDDIYYIVGQNIGSHHVHGTWTSLLLHYLEADVDGNNKFHPRDHNCETHINQYYYISVIIINAIKKFIEYVVSDQASKSELLNLLKLPKTEIEKINKEAIGNDGDLTK